MKTNSNTETETKTAQHTPEVVGRKYQQVRYALHSKRIVGGDGWYGSSHYRTLEDVQKALNGIGQRYQNIGGLVIDLGKAEDLYEYRIVKMVCECEVIHTETKKV